jgi:hypothetical protein
MVYPEPNAPCSRPTQANLPIRLGKPLSNHKTLPANTATSSSKSNTSRSLLKFWQSLSARNRRFSKNKPRPDLIALSANLTQYARNSITGIMTPSLKPIEWIGSSLSDLRKFPEEVQKSMGFALSLAQLGQKHQDAKPLKGFKGSGVLEVVDDFDGDT